MTIDPIWYLSYQIPKMFPEAGIDSDAKKAKDKTDAKRLLRIETELKNLAVQLSRHRNNRPDPAQHKAMAKWAKELTSILNEQTELSAEQATLRSPQEAE